MVVMANFLNALASVLDLALWAYMWVLVARAVISWVNPDPYNPIVQALYKLTEPVLNPVRRLMGGYGLGIDLSPMIVILIIYFLQMFLIRTMHDIAGQLR
ncbi:MAG TPA: YggT family protein [Nitrospiria bacterium]|nr:YggT family protein [Nitrospiria bacterium]